MWLYALGTRGAEIANVYALPVAVIGVVAGLGGASTRSGAPTPGGWLVGAVVIGCAVTFVVAAAAGVWQGASPSSPPPPASRESATIVSPLGDTVPHKFRLSGTLSGVPNGTVIWAASQELDDHRYYPSPGPCIAVESTFDCGTFYVGRVSGTVYALIVFAAPPDAVTELKRDAASNYPGKHGVPALPSDATALVEKRVTLVIN